MTELWIKNESYNSQRTYLEVDLLGQFFSLVVLCAGVAVGSQSQEGRAHGAATRLTAEVLGPAREQTVHGEVILLQEEFSFHNRPEFLEKSFLTVSGHLMNNQGPLLYEKNLLHNENRNKINDC